MNGQTELSELVAQVDSIVVVTEPEPGRIDVRSKLTALWDKVHGIFSPKAIALLDAAKAVKIKDQADYDEAVALLKDIKGTQQDFGRFKAIPDRIHTLWKENLEQYKQDGVLLDQAEYALKGSILDFDRKKQREEQARQAAADAELRKKQQKEADERAAAAKKAGASKNEVAEIKNAPAYMPPAPPVKNTLQRDTAAKTLENWQAEAPRNPNGDLVPSEFARLVAYIVTGNEKAKLAHPEFLSVLDVNEAQLRRLAKAQKQALKLPGVKVYDKGTMRASAW